MRLIVLLFTAILTASTVWAQVPQTSLTSGSSSVQKDGTKDTGPEDQGPSLPVSIATGQAAAQEPSAAQVSTPS